MRKSCKIFFRVDEKFPKFSIRYPEKISEEAGTEYEQSVNSPPPGDDHEPLFILPFPTTCTDHPSLH
jgi:hypothetical protein